MRRAALLTLLLVGTPALAQDAPESQPTATPAAARPVAVIKTNHGEIEVELFADQAPKTVANFLDLAEGRKAFKDSKSRETVKRPFYDGLTFHRVIKGFMLQGGCPQGNGRGSPGYSFKDEINGKSLGLDTLLAFKGGRPNGMLSIRSQRDFQQKLLGPLIKKLGIKDKEALAARQQEVQKKLETLTVLEAYENLGYQYDDTLTSSHPKRGVLAMANSGPNTNGCQFFINLVDTDHLTCKHTVFGRVIKGMDVIDKIGVTAVGAGDKPADDVKIISVRVKVKS